MLEVLVLERGDSLLCPAAARAETGVPERKERVLAWFGAVAPAADVEVGVEDRGVARDVVDGELFDAVGSRPMAGAFLAATVDMIGVVVSLLDTDDCLR